MAKITHVPTGIPRISDVIDGRYKLVRHVSEGSMSIVFRAQRIGLRRSVIIKFLHPTLAANGEFRKRFEIEARIMSQLSHPNCISVVDYGLAELPYIVMELARGDTLKELMENGPMRPSRALRIIRQVLGGLAHAHSRGIVHRDIKPSNIMISEDTCAGDHVCLFDFGLATLVEAERIGLGEEENVAGTLDYMSPEHLKGQELDWRADLFSTGVVLYQMLTGNKPFIAFSVVDIPTMHNKVPLSLGDSNMSVTFSDELEKVLKQALEKNPDVRFQSATDFVDALMHTPEALEPEMEMALEMASKSVHSINPGPISIIPADPSTNRAISIVPESPQKTNVPKRRWIVAGISGIFLLGLGTWVGTRITPSAKIEKTSASDKSMEVSQAPPPGQPAVNRPSIKEEEKEHIPKASLADPIHEHPPEPIEETEEASAPSNVDIEVNSQPDFSKVMLLIRSGKTQSAVDELKQMEIEHPNNGYIMLLLGNLYSDLKQPTNALSHYTKALTYTPEYQSNKILIANVVRCLGKDATIEQARRIIIGHIGKSALPYLNQILTQQYSRVFKQNVRDIIDELSQS